MKNFRLILALSLALVVGFGSFAFAEYPEKPVQLIVPWKAGGGTDALFRVVAHFAGKYLGQPIVIVNVPGVGGTMGARQVGTRELPSPVSSSAQGSSSPAVKIPRGRWYLKLRPTTRTPFASRAEARVSPWKPASSAPLNRNRMTLLRSIQPPDSRR